MGQAETGTGGFKYLDIASELERDIGRGDYPIGRKLPSLRVLCARHGCSLSVVMQAYGELERQGIVEAVEKSGFFARRRPERPLPRPSVSGTVPEFPATCGIMARVLDASIAPGIVSFGAGIPDPSISGHGAFRRRVSGILAARPDLLAMYAPAAGARSLRLEVSRLMRARGVQADAEDIVVTNGCNEALSLAFKACFKPGDAIAVETPLYHGAISILAEAGLRVITLPTDPESGIDVDALESLAKKGKVKGCFVSGSFQNPLGFCLPQESRRRIASLADRYDLMVVEDDIYHDAGFDAVRRYPVKAFDKVDRVVYCSSLSKTGAVGARIGWCVSAGFARRIADLKCTFTLGGPLFLQEAAAEYLARDYEKNIPSLRTALKCQNRELQALVDDTFPEGTRVSRPEGGLFLWLEMPKRMSCDRLFDRALEKGICVTPGSIFDPVGGHGNCVRLSSAVPLTEKHGRALEIIADLIEKENCKKRGRS